MSNMAQMQSMRPAVHQFKGLHLCSKLELFCSIILQILECVEGTTTDTLNTQLTLSGQGDKLVARQVLPYCNIAYAT